MAWLGVSLTDWFGAKVVIFSLLHLSHHGLKERLVLRELFNEGFNDSLKFWYFFLEMFAVLFWYLRLELLDFGDIFDGEVDVLKVDSSLLRIDFEINVFSLGRFLAVETSLILMEPRFFLSKARLACNAETINDEAGCCFVTPLTMVKWYFVRLLHDGMKDGVGVRK